MGELAAAMDGPDQARAAGCGRQGAEQVLLAAMRMNDMRAPASGEPDNTAGQRRETALGFVQQRHLDPVGGEPLGQDARVEHHGANL